MGGEGQASTTASSATMSRLPARRSVTPRLRLDRPSRKMALCAASGAIADFPTACPAKVDTGFAKRTCANKEPEHNDDSKKSHPALETDHIQAVGEALAECTDQVAARRDVIGSRQIVDR